MKLSVPPLILSEMIPPKIVSAEGEVWYDGAGEPCAYGMTTDGHHWLHLPGLASFCFTDTGDEVRVIAQPPPQYDLIRDIYFRSVLPLAFQARGTEVLHASAVHTSRGVVALCAVSGTGKSTLAVGLSQLGYRVWADDAVAVATTGERVMALPFPFALRLRPDAVAFFHADRFSLSPELAHTSTAEEQRESQPLIALCILDRVQEEDEGNAKDYGTKPYWSQIATLSLQAERSNLCPNTEIASSSTTPRNDMLSTLRSKVLSHSPNAAVEILRMSSAQAFPAVLAHAYCFSLRDTPRKQRMVQQYLDLVARVPTYTVRFRSGLEHLTAILDGIERMMQSNEEG